MRRQNIYWSALMELSDLIATGVMESIGKIAVLVQIVFPLIIAISEVTLSQKFLMSCVWVYLVAYMKIVDRRVNRKKKDGFPLPPCQLTTTDKEGFVEIVEGRQEAAIIYLSDVEEWIRKRDKFYKQIDRKDKT